MSFWNYRIIEREYTHYRYLSIHEVYYEEDGDYSPENVTAWTANPITIGCEIDDDIDEDEARDQVVQALELALADVKKHPVLLERELPGYEEPELPL